MMNVPMLHSKIFIRGTIVAETGLHIGGNTVGMAIGGADNVVVRNPLDNQPYIPASSLRGKIRSLLERVRGDEAHNPDEGGMSINGTTAQAGVQSETLLGRLFGVSASENNTEPARLAVRDARLTSESVKALGMAPNTDMPLTEVKTEANIDRLTAKATPRHFERIPAGAVFEFELVLTLYSHDDQRREAFLRLIKEGLDLVGDDALGGHGSRGYGKVQFNVGQIVEKTATCYRTQAAPTTLAESEAKIFQ